MPDRPADLMDRVEALAKRRGFVFPGSELYGGLAGTWDYGPLGVELKQNIKREYWRAMVRERDDTVGIDAAILMHPRVWEASGHAAAFADPLIECKLCHQRLRADDETARHAHESTHRAAGQDPRWTEPRQFNLLVEAKLGAVEDSKSRVWLRGEITQGAHVNFKHVLDASRLAIPFGIVQIGKAFRNEITPGHFTFRSREFEQMELEFYIRPDQAEAARWLEYWKEARLRWYRELGIAGGRLRLREHAPEERAHYARAAWDIEYDTPFGGWKELEGIHHRGDWDLGEHAKHSGQDLSVFDRDTRERYIPWVIETSGGVDRAMLFALLDAYREIETEGRVRTVLALSPRLAPLTAAVFPLLANKPNLVAAAREVFEELKKTMSVAWDERGNIGKRYWSQDEIGTPWCVTIDFQTPEDGTLTVRERDSGEQARVARADLGAYLAERLGPGR